ncbi:MAG: gamma-butyrobetaine hydroxylase-like domain-containing protein [Phycisphaerales bacterium]
MEDVTPIEMDLKKDEGLTIVWSDGVRSYYPISHLRRLSPSADARELRKQIKANPLTVLPGGAGGSSGPLVATDAELVGNYAIKIVFSDGHNTGIYTWSYLREIDPASNPDGKTKSDEAPPHNDPLGLGSKR